MNLPNRVTYMISYTPNFRSAFKQTLFTVFALESCNFIRKRKQCENPESTRG